jgi:hypothetical protein
MEDVPVYVTVRARADASWAGQLAAYELAYKLIHIAPQARVKVVLDYGMRKVERRWRECLEATE